MPELVLWSRIIPLDCSSHRSPLFVPDARIKWAMTEKAHRVCWPADELFFSFRTVLGGSVCLMAAVVKDYQVRTGIGRKTSTLAEGGRNQVVIAVNSQR